jgi:hypothetical protein
MLQIISGKFFGDVHVNEEEQDAILYSNFSWIRPITTSVAELRPVSFGQTSVAAYVVRYINRYETFPGDVLVLPFADEAVDQLRLLLSFWLRSLFHPDRAYVERLCRKTPTHALTETIPSAFVPTFFESKRGTPDQVASVASFITQAIGLPRAQYKLFISCVAIFFDALESLAANFDLAYSMFVYVLEALSQTVQYTSSWDDYDPSVRSSLDSELASIDASTAARIRATLLQGSHLKLTSRFVAFVTTHVDDSFFLSEAVGIGRPIPKGNLAQSLRNLYQTRSGFVHSLQTVHEQLRMPHIGQSSDIFTWDNQPFFSMSGLVRLTHHVLRTFLSRQQQLEKETYPNWRNELPGLIRGYLAPQYWIWKTPGFEARHAKAYFSGFMDFLAQNLGKPTITFPDMRPLMERIETLLGQANDSQRIALLAMYFTFNAMIAEELRRPNWWKVLEKYRADGERCSIETIAPLVVLGLPLGWSPEECASAFEDYRRQKYKPDGVSLPLRFEIAIAAQIANRFLEQGKSAEFVSWTTRATLDAAGNTEIQDLLTRSKAVGAAIDVRALLRGQQEQQTNGMNDLENKIREVAYDLWERRGRPWGNPLTDWRAAKLKLGLGDDN